MNFQLTRTLVAAVCLSAMSSALTAEEWTPPGPIEMRISFGAGGGTDTQARLIAEELEARKGWKIIPVNVPGNGGLTMAFDLTDAPTDGTVIGFGVSGTLGYTLAVSDAPLKPTDFTPLLTTAAADMALVVSADSGWKTFDDVVAAAKGGQNIRAGAIAAQLADVTYLLAKSQGVNFSIANVKGGRAMMNALQAGDMDIGFLAGIQAKAVSDGSLIELVSGMTRPLRLTPDAPLLADYGVNHPLETYFMVYGPKDMDPAATEAIKAAIAEIVADPESKAGAALARIFGGATVVTGDALVDQIQSDYDGASALLEEASQ